MSTSDLQASVVAIVREGTRSEWTAAELIAELRKRGAIPAGMEAEKGVFKLLGEMDRAGVLQHERMGIYELGPNA